MPTLLAPLCALVLLQDAAIERKGAHFHVFSHLADERSADEALQAAEATWPMALAALELEETKLAGPLVVHLYPDAARYAAAEQRLTGGAFAANLSFSHFASRSAHVALQPPCSVEALRELGLPSLTAYLIAHEASHLVSFAYLPNSLDHPDWFAEGMSTHIGLKAMVALGRMRPGEAEPFGAKSSVRCQELLAGGELPTASQVLSAEIGELEFQPRYAVNYRFYELLLAEREQDLAKTVAAIKKQGGGEGYREGLARELGKLWKPKELEKLQEEWSASVQGAKPEWDEVRRSLETRGEGFVQRAFAESNAIAFRTAPVTSVPFTAAGSVRALPGEAHQMNFLLGRSAQGFLSVAFGFGRNVTVFRCDYGATDKWTVLARAECGDLVIGADVPFRIDASAEELVVFVADKELLHAPLHGRSPLGQWGLGAQAGTTGEWKAIAVRSSP